MPPKANQKQINVIIKKYDENKLVFFPEIHEILKNRIGNATLKKIKGIYIKRIFPTFNKYSINDLDFYIRTEWLYKKTGFGNSVILAFITKE
uniref:Uncharacterized protein n=1 Tax=Strongyloides venezuelensis TaxID=75913 RepID=A0A0K0FBC1_STRVS